MPGTHPGGGRPASLAFQRAHDCVDDRVGDQPPASRPSCDPGPSSSSAPNTEMSSRGAPPRQRRWRYRVAATRSGALVRCAALVETMLGIGQEDQPERRPSILARFRGAVGSHRAGRGPKRSTDSARSLRSTVLSSSVQRWVNSAGQSPPIRCGRGCGQPSSATGISTRRSLIGNSSTLWVISTAPCARAVPAINASGVWMVWPLLAKSAW